MAVEHHPTGFEKCSIFDYDHCEHNDCWNSFDPCGKLILFYCSAIFILINGRVETIKMRLNNSSSTIKGVKCALVQYYSSKFTTRFVKDVVKCSKSIYFIFYVIESCSNEPICFMISRFHQIVSSQFSQKSNRNQ